MSKKTGGLPLKVKIGYGAPGWATMFTITIVTTYGLYFLTDVVGMNSGVAGALLTVGALWSIVADPTVGMISDKRNPQKGRRRPFLLWFAIPFGIITCLLFTDFGFGTVGTIIYFGIVVIVYYTLQACLDVPYTSLLGEATEDSHERNQLAGIRMAWAVCSAVLGGYTLNFVAMFEDNIPTNAAWSLTLLGFGVLNAISALVGYVSTKGRENLEENAYVTEKVSIRMLINGPLRIKSYRRMLLAFLCGIVMQAVFLGFMVYYLQNCVELNDAQIAIVNSGMWLISFLWIVPTTWISDRLSKKASNVLTYSVALGAIVIFPFFIVRSSGVVLPLIMCGLMTYTLNGMYQVFYAYLPDFVDLDELQTGQRKEGTFFSCATITQKVFNALTVLVLGLVLGWIGYDPSAAVQSESTVNALESFFIISVAVMSMLSIVFMLSCKLNKKRYEEVRHALELKRAGEQSDIEKFKDLI